MSSTRKSLLPWAIAVGLIPCPAVVMVMLFCVSMEALMLGMLLAACISIGMATTLSFIVVLVILGKSGVLSRVPKKRVHAIEGVIGMLSGFAICIFGALLLFGTLHGILN